MQIFVRSNNSESLLFELPADASVKDLKEAIENVEFIPAHLQRIVYSSEVIASGSLAEIIPDASEVTLEIGVDGGMRAKWRKKRMRRLRRKRRKMRMRAR